MLVTDDSREARNVTPPPHLLGGAAPPLRDSSPGESE